MSDNYISNKKPFFPVSKSLMTYLSMYSREMPISILYSDLRHYQDTIPLEDNTGKATLWETALYPETQMQELNEGLIEIYSILKSDGATHGSRSSGTDLK
jgi:hypothetical protein